MNEEEFFRILGIDVQESDDETSFYYEEYFYENYLKDISEKYILELPDKNLYLKQVHETSPECLKNYQEK